MSGQFYNFINYGLDPETETIDMDQVRDLAKKHKPKPKPEPNPTATPASTGARAHNGAKAVPHDPQVSLCVQVAGAQASSERGSAARWTVSAWTAGGNVPDATVRLQATPASGRAPGFSFGCSKKDGGSSCDLGAIDAKSCSRLRSIPRCLWMW